MSAVDGRGKATPFIGFLPHPLFSLFLRRLFCAQGLGYACRKGHRDLDQRADWGRHFSLPSRLGTRLRRRRRFITDHASPRSIINRCIMGGKERDGCQPLDSFVSLSKSPPSWAPEGRRGCFEAETSCQGNGNISRCKSWGLSEKS